MHAASPIWQPSPERIAQSNLTAFMGEVSNRWDLRIDSYQALHRFSVSKPEKFWLSAWDLIGLVAEGSREVVVEDFDRMPGARWFPRTRLNFAENLLRRRDDADALVLWGENRIRRRISFGELYGAVSSAMRALSAAGVRRGDRVAGLLPNMPETVVAMLATTGIGAIWCACSPEYGVNAIADRLIQVAPRILITADGYYYGGRLFELMSKAAEVADALPSCSQLVVVPHVSAANGGSGASGVLSWQEFLRPYPAREISFERFPFNEPAFVLYSSGTTGTPKCILHGAGGTLLQNVMTQYLHHDVRPDDRVCYWTSTGWVVWNLMVFALGCGATLLLYDGSPFYPTPAILFDYLQSERASFVRFTPKYIETIAKEGLVPAKSHNLSALRSVTVGGAPFSEAGYEYIYSNVKSDLHVASPAGGTDPMGALVTGNPNGPVWPGECQAPALGMSVQVFDRHGQPVHGTPGELVCTRPFPSMPLGYWNDPGNRRFREAYFSVYENVWRHGDWAEVTDSGGIIIHGRSDATMNVRGMRIGTAEIYRQLSSVLEIEESVVVAQDWEGDSRIVLFLQLKKGHSLDQDLIERIRNTIRENASPHHVPSKIVQVGEIPRTVTGKASEAAVKAAIHGREIQNRGALINPGSLDIFRNMQELST